MEAELIFPRLVVATEHIPIKGDASKIAGSVAKTLDAAVGEAAKLAAAGQGTEGGDEDGR